MGVCMSVARAALGRPGAGFVVSRPLWEQDVSWQDQAECRSADTNLFFPPQIQETREEKEAREAQAKIVCARCPVKDACLEFALSTREPYGIWGGLNEIERRLILHRQQEAG